MKTKLLLIGVGLATALSVSSQWLMPTRWGVSPFPAMVGQPVTLTAGFGPDIGGTYTVQIDWGDGQTTHSGGPIVWASHVYTNWGAMNVSVWCYEGQELVGVNGGTIVVAVPAESQPTLNASPQMFHVEHATPGAIYRVERSTDFATWSTVLTAQADASGVIRFVPDNQTAIYRAVSP